MEVIGRFKVRILPVSQSRKESGVKDEKVIRTPPGVWGEYILEAHEDGSFTYRPAEGQIISMSSRYQVWDPENVCDPISFSDEKKAIEYKERMEKKFGRQFRMKKLFRSNGSEKLVEAT